MRTYTTGVGERLDRIAAEIYGAADQAAGLAAIFAANPAQGVALSEPELARGLTLRAPELAAEAGASRRVALWD